ncbi:hypothetical protein EIP91_012017 [Steccherinum ochraceum]|uniref:Uncharacterized protein n=1 Tax=Steccherinum ochraceum TaxID=92696 RepID=A0A4R0RQN6_9APHY|nr:hypothetical protein EIP91_012017 [Steccherinum ochraceum]
MQHQFFIQHWARVKWENPFDQQTTSTATTTPPLALLPAEILDEIISYWDVLPTRFYCMTYGATATQHITHILPRIEYAERTYTLRALSQTCKALRQVILPRLWSRLECCWVPQHKQGLRFQYVMELLRRKAKGMMEADDGLKSHVRILCILLSRASMETTLSSINMLLPTLPNLQTIQILHCRTPGLFESTVKGLHLPSVRTLIIPTECNALVMACPNVTHIRCAGGNGYSLVFALKHGNKLEKLDGMIDWGCGAIMKLLVKYAPHLHTLELRHPVDWFHGALSSWTRPPAWADVIPELSHLTQLRVLQLSFSSQAHANEMMVIQAARKVMIGQMTLQTRKLEIRRVIAPNVDQVISTFTPDELVHLMASVFANLSQSKLKSAPANPDIAMPHRTVVPTSAHNVLFMPSRMAPFGTAMKVVSVPTASAPQEVRDKGLPATTLVMDEQSGQVKAIVNAAKLTALRNAAGSLLSSRLLISPDKSPRTLVAIGSGAQIAAHVSLFIRHYSSITQCTIFNRSLNSRLTSLIDTLRADPAFRSIEVNGHILPKDGDSPEHQVYKKTLQDANIVVTATSSTKPLFPSSYISPGTHLCMIGSYAPRMHEVDTDLVKRAGTIVVDSREACKIEAGELIAANIQDDDLIEIGELVSLSGSQWEANQPLVERVRKSGDVTMFKSVGVGVQDVAIASAVVDKAAIKGLGVTLQL